MNEALKSDAQRKAFFAMFKGAKTAAARRNPGGSGSFTHFPHSEKGYHSTQMFKSKSGRLNVFVPTTQVSELTAKHSKLRRTLASVIRSAKKSPIEIPKDPLSLGSPKSVQKVFRKDNTLARIIKSVKHGDFKDRNKGIRLRRSVEADVYL